MDSALMHLILQDRQIAYALTNRELEIIETGGATDILYYDPPPALARSLLELAPELIGSEEALADLLSGNLPRFELNWINRDTAAGQRLYLTLVYLPYQDQTGQIIGLLHVAENITETGIFEQRLAQQRNDLRLLQAQLTRQNLELATANAELKRLDEAKSMFVSIAAHELRTPLTLISGYLEVLQDEDVGPLTPPQHEYLEIVHRNTQRLLHLISHLLDLTRIETGRIELQLKPVNLSQLLTNLASEFELQVADKGHSLSLHLTSDLPYALCDEARTNQIISNLLSNAIKYTPTGGQIQVNLGLAQAEGFVQVTVEDNGIGMTSEDQSRLFQRFFRASSGTLNGVKGAGLGLYITRSLVDLHGGQIWCQSVLNQGSAFFVTFPIAGHHISHVSESASF
ncbi:MAG: ATP-binding protein [Anaerolineae bacterium]